MVSEQIMKAEEGENEESPSSSAKFDVLDMPSKKADVSNFDIFCLVMSIATHIIDLAFDINVACHYLSYGQYSHFTITLLVILIPSFINNAVSYRMRQQDREVIMTLFASYFFIVFFLFRDIFFTVFIFLDHCCKNGKFLAQSGS